MVTATIVVFLAIFGGMAFLAFLIWLIFRRRGNSSSSNQRFVGDSSQTTYHNSPHQGIVETDSDELEVEDNSYYSNDVVNNNYSNEANTASEQTASDSPTSNETYESPTTSQSDYSAPADYSSSDSSSYDSGGSSDSGSSSSSD